MSRPRKNYNNKYVPTSNWFVEFTYEWNEITDYLRKYDLSKIQLVSSEMADARREKINGEN